MTQAERLIRIETLLEGISNRLEKIETHQTAQDVKAAATKADFDELKNKGVGLLVGVGLLAGGVGAFGGKVWDLIK